MRQHGLSPIPTDGRLNLLIRRAQEHARNATLIAKLTPNIEQKFERPRHHRDPADTRTLRGIPAIGKGVAGATPGSNPHAIIDRWQ